MRIPLLVSYWLLCCAIIVFCAPTAQARHIADSGHYTALRPGMWEIRTATRMQGMPAELPPIPYTTVQCLTQEQLDNQQNLAAVSGTQGQCDIHEAQVTEQRTRWTMTCSKNGLEAEAEGVITPISREVYTGNVRFTMKGNAMTAVRGVVNVQGNWTGECSGQDAPQQMEPRFRHPVYTPE